MGDQPPSDQPPLMPPQPQVPRLFAGARREWTFVARFLAFSGLFWLAEFWYQYAVLIPGETGGSLVRSFGLAGATFFAAALFSSALFKWRPASARYWYVRRSLGVMGFVFIALHVWSVTAFLFQGNVAGFFWSFDPVQNPLLLGLAAYPVFFLMAITSTDWAVAKMGFRRWKALHRLVYFAYALAVFHFLTINPQLLLNPAGYLLLAMTVLAVGGELLWFVATVRRKRSTKGAVFGVIVIAFWLLLGYLAFFSSPIQPLPGLEQDIARMKLFMQQNPLPVPNATEPLEQSLEGAVVRQGTFRNLNYLSTGTASLVQSGGASFVVFGEDFSTPNGPDLVVYLTKNVGPTSRQDVAEGVALGKLHALSGKQAYQIPANTDVNGFRSVTIHCRAFNVPWSYAPLDSP